MEWEITRVPNFNAVSLSEIKSYLRINNSIEDDKLSSLEKSAVSYWENQTSYILNAQGLKLSIIPSRDLLLNNYPKSSDYLSGPDKPLYSPSLALDIETQKPSALSYTKDGAQTQATPEELSKISSVFFNVVQKVPLQFYLYFKNFPFPLFGALGMFGFQNQYHSKIILDLNCNGLAVEEDIKQTLLRIIAGLFENPDVSSESLANDDFINTTMDNYNCGLGIA